ncbi:MAG: hypothetical protein V1774_00385 [Candidatus Eisenbacteria bacterium]
MEETLGNRFLQQVKELCELAGIKTEEYARIGRKRLDALSLEREVAKKKSALGQRVCDLSRQEGPGDVLADAEVRALLARIDELEVVLGTHVREIGSIREAAHGRTHEVRRRYEAQRVADRAGSSHSPAAATATPWDEPHGPADDRA